MVKLPNRKYANSQINRGSKFILYRMKNLTNELSQIDSRMQDNFSLNLGGACECS